MALIPRCNNGGWFKAILEDSMEALSNSLVEIMTNDQALCVLVQVIKRRRMEERGFGQQDYTRRIISSYRRIHNAGFS
ncbi:unnamed protein product [Camellia sinensis]